MFLKSIKVHKNKALQVAGIKTLEITDIGKILVIIGDNGSGKTTLKNILTPLPSSQTDYNKGKIELTMSHFNQEIVTISDFSKGIDHSFLVNKEDMNISGNTNAQKDLCESQLKLTPFINDIINIKFRITDMTPMDRKNLFFNAYPYMYTVLEKHKKVSTILKANNSNLKMLNTRRSELLSELIDPRELKVLRDKYNLFMEQTNNIDKIVYSLTEENKGLADKLRSIKSNSMFAILTQEEVIEVCKKINNKYIKVYRNIKYPNIDENSLDLTLNNLGRDMDSLSSESESISSTIISIKEEIEKFEAFLNTNIEKEKSDISIIIETTKKALDELVVDERLVILTDNEISYISNNILPKLEEHIVFIKSLNIRILKSRTIDLARNKIEELQNLIYRNELNLENLNKILNEYKSTILTYPPNVCDHKCLLKESALKHINSLESNIKSVSSEIDTLLATNSKYRKKVNSLFKLLEGQDDLYGGYKYVQNIVNMYPWGKYISGDNLLVTLNKNPFYILNNLKNLLKNSRFNLLRIEYNNIIQTNLLKLDIINKTPSIDLIDSTLLNKQTTHAQLLKKYNLVTEDLNKASYKYNQMKDVFISVKELQAIRDKWDLNREYNLLKHTYIWNTNYITNLNRVRSEIQSNIITLEGTIQKQDNINIRLDGEIYPSINKIKEIVKKYSLIEKSLNPNSGIPSKYITKFLNNLIMTTNHYIQSILSYDMELLQIEESGNINYIFPIKIKDDVVPDIAKTSTAQANIINLAFGLAMYKNLRLNKDFPLILDEPDSGFSEGNRERLLQLLATFVGNGTIWQMVIVSHFASIIDGFSDADVICLDPTNIILPMKYNTNVVMKKN